MKTYNIFCYGVSASVTLDLGFLIAVAVNLLLRNSSGVSPRPSIFIGNVTLHPGFFIALALDLPLHKSNYRGLPRKLSSNSKK